MTVAVEAEIAQCALRGQWASKRPMPFVLSVSLLADLAFLLFYRILSVYDANR